MKNPIRKVTAIAVASLVALGAAGPAFAATAKVGGGDWHYGTYLAWNGKACYSNYMHYGVSHGSTAIIASARDSDWQAAGRWSEATAVAGIVYDCSTYWRT